jgi:hypothetical protein
MHVGPDPAALAALEVIFHTGSIAAFAQSALGEHLSEARQQNVVED